MASPIGSAGKRLRRPLGVGAAAPGLRVLGSHWARAAGAALKRPTATSPGTGGWTGADSYPKKGVCVLAARPLTQPLSGQPERRSGQDRGGVALSRLQKSFPPT